jgi:CubicO group peptidase (beta-lactamase class C family)
VTGRAGAAAASLLAVALHLTGCGGADAASGRGDRAAAAATADAGGAATAGAGRAAASLDRAPARPPTVGLDSAFLAAALETAAGLPRLHTLIIARHGHVEAERHFRGPGLHAPANVKSVSKSVLSALVGIAIADGHLEGVTQPVAPFFPEYLRADDDPRRHAITIGHLLSMQSGLERTSGAGYGPWVSSPNWVRYALTRPMVAEPGGQRIYSTGNSHLLSAVLTRATGMSTLAYARQRLGEPLGIRIPRWLADPQGIYLGGNEMRLSPRDLLRFGELYRNHGRHHGDQVVPEEWIDRSLAPRAASRWTGDGYGYGWFLTRIHGYPTFYAWGYGGQFIFVVPDLELTVVATSDANVARERDHTRAVRRLLAERIIPAAMIGRPGDQTLP